MASLAEPPYRSAYPAGACGEQFLANSTGNSTLIGTANPTANTDEQHIAAGLLQAGVLVSFGSRNFRVDDEQSRSIILTFQTHER